MDASFRELKREKRERVRCLQRNLGERGGAGKRRENPQLSPIMNGKEMIKAGYNRLLTNKNGY